MYRKLCKKRSTNYFNCLQHFTVPTGKAHWEILVRARAIENSVFVVATNMCGTFIILGRKTYGHSLIWWIPGGKIKNKSLYKTSNN